MRTETEGTFLHRHEVAARSVVTATHQPMAGWPQLGAPDALPCWLVTTTGFDPTELAEVTAKLQAAGWQYDGSLTTKTRILIAKPPPTTTGAATAAAVGPSAKMLQALKRPHSIHVVSVKWVKEGQCDASRVTEFLIDPLLFGYEVCTTSLTERERAAVRRICEREGAVYATALTRRCKMLVIADSGVDVANEKIQYADRHPSIERCTFTAFVDRFGGRCGGGAGVVGTDASTGMTCRDPMNAAVAHSLPKRLDHLSSSGDGLSHSIPLHRVVCFCTPSRLVTPYVRQVLHAAGVQRTPMLTASTTHIIALRGDEGQPSLPPAKGGASSSLSSVPQHPEVLPSVDGDEGAALMAALGRRGVSGLMVCVSLRWLEVCVERCELVPTDSYRCTFRGTDEAPVVITFGSLNDEERHTVKRPLLEMLQKHDGIASGFVFGLRCVVQDTLLLGNSCPPDNHAAGGERLLTTTHVVVPRRAWQLSAKVRAVLDRQQASRRRACIVCDVDWVRDSLSAGRWLDAASYTMTTGTAPPQEPASLLHGYNRNGPTPVGEGGAVVTVSADHRSVVAPPCDDREDVAEHAERRRDRKRRSRSVGEGDAAEGEGGGESEDAAIVLSLEALVGRLERHTVVASEEAPTVNRSHHNALATMECPPTAHPSTTCIGRSSTMSSTTTGPVAPGAPSSAPSATSAPGVGGATSFMMATESMAGGMTTGTSPLASGTSLVGPSFLVSPHSIMRTVGGTGGAPTPFGSTSPTTTHAQLRGSSPLAQHVAAAAAESQIVVYHEAPYTELLRGGGGEWAGVPPPPLGGRPTGAPPNTTHRILGASDGAAIMQQRKQAVGFLIAKALKDDAELMQAVETSIVSKGLATLVDLPEVATHYIVGKPAKTETLLCFVAAGKYLLQPSYLVSCCSEGSLVAEGPHEWAAMSAVQQAAGQQAATTVPSSSLTSLLMASRVRSESQLQVQQQHPRRLPFESWVVLLTCSDPSRSNSFSRVLRNGGCGSVTAVAVADVGAACHNTTLPAWMHGVTHVFTDDNLWSADAQRLVESALKVTISRVEGIVQELCSYRLAERA